MKSQAKNTRVENQGGGFKKVITTEAKVKNGLFGRNVIKVKTRTDNYTPDKGYVGSSTTKTKRVIKK